TATATGPSGNAGGRSGAGEFGGTLSNVRITGNSVEVSSAAGNTTVDGGASVFDAGTINNSSISDNRVDAAAPHGSADVMGSIHPFGPPPWRNSNVRGNPADASSARGSARGGGIYAAGLTPDAPPGGPLALHNSKITPNTLSGTAGIQLQGGG